MTQAQLPALETEHHDLWERTRSWQALNAVQNAKPLQRLGWILAFGVAALAVVLVTVPWQQNIPGTGRIFAYLPQERPQTVESPIYGKVERWGEGIVQGARVNKGQFILEIRDNDPMREERLKEQVSASESKLEFAKREVESYEVQIEAFDSARNMVMEAGRKLVEEAKRKVAAAQAGVEAADAGLAQTTSNLKRQSSLEKLGAVAMVNLEKDLRSQQEAEAKLKAAKEYVLAETAYLASKEAELQQKSFEAQTKIDKARADFQKAQGAVSLAEKELADARVKQSQFASRQILAPKDGYIYRLYVAEDAQMLKEGEPLFQIVPDATEMAVELLVSGNDAPLINLDAEVRLQFEGWPAFQVAAGWPEITAGTFAGRVVAVDATDNGKGKYSVLVRPDPKNGDWPSPRFLRQGGRATGWVLLEEVKLGYEIWRQFNGFPPVLNQGDKGADPMKDATKSAKQVLQK